MKLGRLFYVVSVLIIGWGGLLGALASDQQLVVIGVAMFAMAILSYPLGSLVSLAEFTLIALGLTTQVEVFAIAVPAYAIFGYLQWYRLLPRLYGKKSEAA